MAVPAMLNRIHATAPHIISHITQCGRPRQRHIRNPAHQSRSFASRTTHAYALQHTHPPLRVPHHAPIRIRTRPSAASRPAPHTSTHQDIPNLHSEIRTAHAYALQSRRPVPHRARIRATSRHTASHRPIPRTCTRQDTPVQRLVTRIAHLYAPRVVTQLPTVPHRAPIRAKTPQPRIPRPTQRTYAHPDTLIRRTHTHPVPLPPHSASRTAYPCAFGYAPIPRSIAVSDRVFCRWRLPY